MKCKICSTDNMEFLFSHKILHKHSVRYFNCRHCQFIQTEEPFWLNEAYKDPINSEDTGILARNFMLAEKTAVLIHEFFDKSKCFLDYAGGYGIMTRLMRDLGFDFYWSDIYANNIFAKYFEYKEESTNIELITSFESFEHFARPMDDIEKMLKKSPNIFFSTTLQPHPRPEPESWWYYAFDHGQHIAFYSTKTLEVIASIFGLNLCTNFSYLHLLTNKDISQKTYLKKMKHSRRILQKKMKGRIISKTEEDSRFIQKMISENR